MVELPDILDVVEALALPAALFGSFAAVRHGRNAWARARETLGETWINVGLYAFDAVAVAPVLAVAVAWLTGHLRGASPGLPLDGLSKTQVVFLTVFLGDFVSYWRHRLEHSAALWPAHAIHHGDTRPTWLTLLRMHPVDRLVSVLLDNAVLALLGVPTWALAANNLVRHWYGMFVHVDVGRRLRPLGWFFITPDMHRWHHASAVRDVNFATVFSVFDRAFGTLHDPGECVGPLGAGDPIRPGVGGQLAHPFREWARALARRRADRARDGDVRAA